MSFSDEFKKACDDDHRGWMERAESAEATLAAVRAEMRTCKETARGYIGQAHAQILADSWVRLWALLTRPAGTETQP